MVATAHGKVRPGTWWYFLSPDDHGSMIRDRLQWVRAQTRRGQPIVVVTPDGLAPRQVMSDVPVAALAEVPSRVDAVVAGRWSDIPEPMTQGCRVIVHDLDLQPQIVPPSVERIGRAQTGYALARHFLIPGAQKNPDATVMQYHSNSIAALQCLEAAGDWPMSIMPPDPHELEWAGAIHAAGWCVILSSMLSPRACLEAMAGGCVVLASGAAAARAIRHGENGWVVDPVELSAAFIWLRQPQQAALVARLRANALATAWQHAEAIP